MSVDLFVFNLVLSFSFSTIRRCKWVPSLQYRKNKPETPIFLVVDLWIYWLCFYFHATKRTKEQYFSHSSHSRGYHPFEFGSGIGIFFFCNNSSNRFPKCGAQPSQLDSQQARQTVIW